MLAQATHAGTSVPTARKYLRAGTKLRTRRGVRIYRIHTNPFGNDWLWLEAYVQREALADGVEACLCRSAACCNNIAPTTLALLFASSIHETQRLDGTFSRPGAALWDAAYQTRHDPEDRPHSSLGYEQTRGRL
jgi:hypothetical protein